MEGKRLEFVMSGRWSGAIGESIKELHLEIICNSCPKINEKH